MKKLLPLVALLVTAAFSAPLMAQPATTDTAKTATKDGHKHHHHKGHNHKGGHKGTHHKGHKGKHHHDQASSQHYHPSMESGRTVTQEQPVQAPTKVWMPSMQHGFQK